MRKVRETGQSCAPVRIHSGFMKHVCFDESRKSLDFKCANTDTPLEIKHYVVRIDTRYGNYYDSVSLVSNRCNNDTYAYQACGFASTEITKTADVLCGQYYDNNEVGGMYQAVKCKDIKKYHDLGADKKDCNEGQDDLALCDDECDNFSKCIDESDCDGHKYGVHCRQSIDHEIYVPVTGVCDGDQLGPIRCLDGSDEKNCTVTNSTVDTCIHYAAKLNWNVKLTVPILNHTRCSVLPANDRNDTKRYCLNYLDQTNCSDINRVGGYCKINGYMSTVSKYMLCKEVDQKTNEPIKLCEDDFQNKCFSPNPDCKIHIHKMCDEVTDCSDGSDEINDLCIIMTDKLNFTCTRRFQLSKGDYKIPLSWIMNNVTDCLNGEDENSSRWKFCKGPGKFKELEAMSPGQFCPDVFKCRPTDNTSFVPFDKLCDGAESCGDGEENKVCRIARDFPNLNKTAFKNGTMLTVCNASISTCEVKEFRKPWGDVFGEPKRNMYFPTSKVGCSETFGEEYLFLSCMNLCTEEKATCPLFVNNGSRDRRLEFDSCPGQQYQNRTYTLGNNSFLTFLVKSDEHGRYHQDFYKCNNNRCVDYKQVCDLVDDCGDMSDEINCANHMICKNTVNETKHHFISLSQKCDGIYDCFDLSDECNDSCRKYILGNWVIKCYCWLLGILAILLNLTTVTRFMISIKDCATEGMMTSKVLMSLIGLGDFLIGLYLVVLSIYDSIIYGETYCENQAKWLTGTACLALGVISTVGSQLSLFSMTVMSFIRLRGVISMKIPGPVNKRAVARVSSLVLVIVSCSLAISLVPLAPFLEDYFVQGMYYDPAYKVFIGFPTKEKHINVLSSYYEDNTTKRKENVTLDMSWSEIRKKVDAMWDQGSLAGSPVHFYGNDGVCLFKYFVRTDDARRSRQTPGIKANENDPVVWTMLAVNLFCFMIISLCYIVITYKTRKSVEDSGQQNNPTRMKEVTAIQKKVMIIIATDFLCWVPFIFISGLHNLEYIDASTWYATFAMIVLPFNSVINPLVYDGELKNYFKNIIRKVTKRWNQLGAKKTPDMRTQKIDEGVDSENIRMKPINKETEL